MFGCKHNWEIISNETTESKFEHSIKQVGTLRTLTKTGLPWQLCDATRKKIQILQCKKCGQLKRFVTEI